MLALTLLCLTIVGDARRSQRPHESMVEGSPVQYQNEQKALVEFLASVVPAAGWQVAGALQAGGLSGTIPRTTGKRMPSRFADVKMDEDKEFEEWLAQKKKTVGVDMDSDFAKGRRVEAGMYNSALIIGGVATLAAAIWAYLEGYITPQFD